MERRRPSRWKAAPGARCLTLLLAAWCGSASAEGVVVTTGAELNRAGASVVMALPDGSVATSLEMLQACAPLLPGEADLVVHTVASGACRVAPTLSEALSRPGSNPVLALGGVEVTTAAECLNRRAVLYTVAESALLYCLAWSECTDLAVAITGAAEVCAGAAAQLDAGPGWTSHLWSPGGETTRFIEVTPAATTAYQVVVADAQQCTGQDTFTLTVNPLPHPEITGATVICSGDEIVLDAGAGWQSHLWSPGGATTRHLVAAPSTSTDYQVEVVDEYGCNGISAPHPVTVLDCTLVLTDGFEGGGLGAWSTWLR